LDALKVWRPVFDCAVLFTVMVGVALAPISVGGWGLRELAVVSLLGAHGLAPERALIFSVCFGLVAVIGVLPGLVVWLSIRCRVLPRARPADGGDGRSQPP
jgi:glycosyltransferase 2 family protein